MKQHGIILDKDRFYKIAHRRTAKPVAGDWNFYYTYTGAAAGLRAFRKHGPPARSGPHQTPPEIKALRRVR